MNPLITKAIECLPKEKITQLEMHEDFPEMVEVRVYNQCRQEIIDHSLPIIFKMIQDKLLSEAQYYSCSRKCGGISPNCVLTDDIINLLTIERPEEIPQMKGTLEALDKLTIEKK